MNLFSQSTPFKQIQTVPLNFSKLFQLHLLNAFSFSIHFLACKKCNAEWCWDCKRSWSDHDETTGGFFRCKFFDPTQDYEKNEEDDEDDEVNGENNEEKETEETKQRSTLERFTRCLRRYNAHEQEGKYSKRRERASRIWKHCS